jgi:hypothetical protein
LISSEIFPTYIKGQANGLITCANWIVSLIITSIYFTITFTDIGKVISYSVMAVTGLFSIWFVHRYIGETKGLLFAECVKLYQLFSGSETFKHDKEAITRILDNAGNPPQHRV